MSKAYHQASLSVIAVFVLLVGLAWSCRSSPTGTVPARPEIEVPAWEPVFQLVEAWDGATPADLQAVAVGRAATADTNGDGLTTAAELDALGAVLDAADSACATLTPVEAAEHAWVLAALRVGLEARHVAARDET